MDVMGELQTMIQSGGLSRAKLTAILRDMAQTTEKKVRRPCQPTMPVVQYTEVERSTTCLHCNTIHVTHLKFKEKEDSVGIVRGGKVMIINAMSPAKVECVSTYCIACEDFVKRMSREELEERYMVLLTGNQKMPTNYGILYTKESREEKEE